MTLIWWDTKKISRDVAAPGHLAQLEPDRQASAVGTERINDYGRRVTRQRPGSQSAQCTASRRPRAARGIPQPAPAAVEGHPATYDRLPRVAPVKRHHLSGGSGRHDTARRQPLPDAGINLPMSPATTATFTGATPGQGQADAASATKSSFLAGCAVSSHEITHTDGAVLGMLAQQTI